MFKAAKMKYLLAVAAVPVAAFGAAACGAEEEASVRAAVQASADEAQAAAEAAQEQVAELEKELEAQKEQANSEPPPTCARGCAGAGARRGA